SAAEDRLDVGQEAVLVLRGGLDTDVRGREPTLADLLDLDGDRQAQRGEGGAHRLRIDAGVDQGGERHVAADAAETIEMGYTHGRPSSAVNFIKPALNVP